MVTHDTAWPAGTPCWVDLGTGDVAGACAFYAGLFGWDAQAGPPEAGGYTMCLKEGRPVAGIGPKQGPPGTPAAWTTYLASDDVDETAGRIKSAGGELLAGPMDVMDAGRMAVGADPGGAVYGIWQARAHIGFGLANEPGSVVWNENMSREFDRNKAFYQDLFGYEYADMEGTGFRYATFRVAGRDVGGLGELDSTFPADIPAHWMVYFAVTDTDATVAAASASGGGVMRPPWDTPYGRMAILTDDQGAVFAAMSQSAASQG